MEHIESDIDLQIDNPAKSAANLIEWNVDMKVTVSNVKKSKMFQRSRTIVLFLLVIVFAVFLSHLRKEVRALQMQVESVNVNLLLLMSKYDRLNRSLNRAWIQRSEMLLGKRNLYDVKELVARKSSISKTIEIFGGIPNATNGSSRAYNSIVPRVNSVKNRKYLLHNDAHSKIDRKSLMEFENNEIANDTNVRFERAILALEKQNVTERNVQSNRDNDAGLQLDIWREPRSRRLRRDEGREPLVATFVGAIPEQHVTDTVYIGPWVKSTRNNTRYSLNKFHLVEDKKSIEVTVTGLYMISAQIFYFGEPTNYSYWILLSSEGKSATQKLVKCSTASSTTATEVSCYTSVITPLQRGDRVRIQQQERDRFINMREGHSYIQLVLLSNSICKKSSR